MNSIFWVLVIFPVFFMKYKYETPIQGEKIFTEKIKQRTLGYFVLAHNIGVSSRAVARLGDET